MKTIAIAATLALLVFAAPAEARCHTFCVEATEDYVACMTSGEDNECTETYLEVVGGHAQEHVEELGNHLP